MSPSLPTVLLTTLLAASALSSAHVPSNHRSQNRRHSGMAARRDAGEFDILPHHQSKPRTILLGKRTDGGACKTRPTGSVQAVSSSAVSSWTSQPSAPSSSPVTYSAPVTTASVEASSVEVSVAVAAQKTSTQSTYQAAATTTTSSSDSVASTSVAQSPATTSVYQAPTTSVYQAPTTSVYQSPTTSAAVATTSSSASASVSVVATVSSSTVKKAGLAWPNGNSDQPGVWASAIGNSWYYTWSPWPVDQLTGLEFVPMLWGWRQVGDWSTNIDSYAGLGVKAALFLNEPNNAGQSSCTVDSACQLWTEQFEQLRTKVPGIELGSAAPDSSPAGKTWLQTFESTCTAASPDFYALHWYDVTYQAFQAYVLDFATTFNKPIWVTEYACQNFNGGAQCTSDYISGEFFQGTTEWMVSAPQVARFAAFGAMEDMQGVNTENAFMQSGGGLTSLGWQYVKA